MGKLDTKRGSNIDSNIVRNIDSNIVGSLDTNHSRNPGLEFSADLFREIRINKSAVDLRAATVTKRRSVKKDNQAAWLLKAISCIDLTTLAGDDTPSKVRRLCAKARAPITTNLIDALDIRELNIQVGAVCVYHNMVYAAVSALDGTNIPVAAVSTGFPAAQIAHNIKVAEVKASVKAGAKEIDIVISREKVLTGDWKGLYREVAEFRAACGDSHLKTILATGELGTLTNVARASWVCMMAGADFIKTSTGKESVNATLSVTLVMLRCIRDYEMLTGFQVGFKPAGGIKTAKEAIEYLVLIKEELGDDWLSPQLFRFGASSLLTDIERQLEHHVTGRYSAVHRHPMA